MLDRDLDPFQPGLDFLKDWQTLVAQRGNELLDHVAVVVQRCLERIALGETARQRRDEDRVPAGFGLRVLILVWK